MKQITLSKTLVKMIAIFALGIFLIPVFAKADAVPTVTVLGASNISANDARIQVMVNTNQTTVDYGNLPEVYIQYSDPSGNLLSTGISGIFDSSDVEVFDLQNLIQGTTYSYKVITTYNGGTVTSNPETFTTQVSGASFVSSTATNPSPTLPQGKGVATSSTNNQGSNYTPAKFEPQTSVFAKLSPTKIETNVTNDVATGGVTHSNGIVLYISDEHARVYQGDTVTFTIEAQNTHSYDVNDAQVSVQLPDQYQFDNSSSVGADYDPQSDIVTYSFDTIPAETTKTFTFTADAVGEGSGTVQTTATLQYDGGQLSATDHDAYDSGSKSLLGASVFGAGFFPQTFTGWFLILLLIAIIIIVARRYVKAPKPAPVQPHPVA